MLVNSFMNTVNNGIYIENIVIFYKKLSFSKIIKLFYSINLYLVSLFFFKIGLQFKKNEMMRILDNNNPLLLKKFNGEFIKMTPPFKSFLKLRNYNILQKYLIKSYSGKCHALGKPVRGQRTWSNAQSAKATNLYLKKYLKSKLILKKKGKKDFWS